MKKNINKIISKAENNFDPGHDIIKNAEILVVFKSLKIPVLCYFFEIFFYFFMYSFYLIDRKRRRAK